MCHPIRRDPQQECKGECTRIGPGVLCCAPQSPVDMNVTFLLHEQTGAAYRLSWHDVNSHAWHKRAQRYTSMVMIMAGWNHVQEMIMDPNPWLRQAAEGFLRRGSAAVMTIDWSHGNGLNVRQSVANVKTIGWMVGRIITAWNIRKKLLLIGFSLGGQVINVAGRYVQAHSRDAGRIAECHALDPGLCLLAFIALRLTFMYVHVRVCVSVYMFVRL